MRLFSGKRIGQSGQEFATAASLSFFFHVILLAAAFLYVQTTPRTFTPPFYDVKLVGQPAEQTALPQATQGANQPPLPRQTAKTLPKGKKSVPRARKAPAGKGAMPELARLPKKTVPVEQEQSSQPPSAGGVTTGPGIAVNTPQQDFKFGYYLAQVRDKISLNWRPPPDAPDAKARVTFSINRSGWVMNVSLDEGHSSGNFGFKQAAIRAIRSSNPFPVLPEDFSKQSLEFSVDLTTE